MGAGVAGLWSLALSLPRGRPAAALAIGLLAAAIPTTQARMNLAYNDRRDDTFDTVYFAQLFRQITGRRFRMCCSISTVCWSTIVS